MNQIPAPDSEQNETSDPSMAGGRRLRAAREALGLGCDDVARELRLQEKLIAALEAGDRSQLPPATFISGYLRAYARLVNLPADELIAEYLAERVAPSLYRTTDGVGMPKMTRRAPKFRFTSFALVAAIALLLAAWWVNQRFPLFSPETTLEEAGSEEHQDIEANLPAPMPLYQDPPAEEPLAEQAQNIDGALPAADTKTLPAAAPAVTAAPTAPGAPTSAPVAPAAVTPVTPADTTAAETAKPEQTLPSIENRPLAASVPQSSLVMEYQAASWTQIEDARGRVLAYQTVPAGRKLQLQGVAPFKVYLGYAPGVIVYYNGTLFAHSAYHRGDLARFRVGSSQDNRPLVR